jgi:PKD repeat protein
VDRWRGSDGWLVGVLVALIPACGDDRAARDAGVDARDGAPRDDAGTPDAPTPLTWVDFAVSGCPAPIDADADAGDDPLVACRGRAPLTLTLAVVAPAPTDLIAWSFGDGTPIAAGRSVTHEWSLPGTYDVSLDVQGPGGSAGVVRPGAIEVVPATAGDPCTTGEQCAGGRCLCGGGECGPAAGVCAPSCDAGCTDPGTVCAALGGGIGDAPWHGQACLPECSAAACPDGLACRDLLDPDGAFVRACFLAGVGGDLGDPCAGPDGEPVDGACTSGRCLALGVRGLCGASCADDGCPASATCARFTGGGSSCLLRCDVTTCDLDPWLACELAGGPGDLGFVVDESPSSLGYCAPRACDDAPECVIGACSSGFCGP